MKRFRSQVTRIEEALSYLSKRSTRENADRIKIFCVGRNKTGTTSLASFFRRNGYKVGNQERGELLLQDWVRRDFTRIIEFCCSAEVFQDIPFSLPETYSALDRAYPGSKFVLSIRSTPEEWYNSLVSFHMDLVRGPSRPPAEHELADFAYRGKYQGWLLQVQQVVYGYPNIPLYDKQAYMAHYEEHNARVVEYFQHRPDDLLVLNLSDAAAFEGLCRFVGLDPATARPIPHLNRGPRR